MTETDEKEIIKKAQAGDRSACDLLFAKYRNLVRMKAGLYFMAGADKDDVEQEGMLGLLNAIRSYDADKGAVFKTFADLCITRQIQTAIKAAHRKKHTPLNEYTSLHMSLTDEEGEEGDALIDTIASEVEADPLTMLIDQELYADVENGIDNLLSSFEKQVISMHLDGMSYTEIAQRLDKSPKQVDNALQRIKKKLKKIF